MNIDGKSANTRLNNGVMKPQRVLSVDALRGFDMVWILGAEGIFAALFVVTGWPWLNNLASQMQHSSWHGITAYDVIFPLFIFLAGVSLGISAKPMNQYSVQKRKTLFLGCVKRLCLLVLLGIVYNHGWGTGIPMHVEEVRFASVLGRIAIAWFVAAMLCWYVSEKGQWLVAGFILIAYWLLLTFVEISGLGAGDFSADGALNVWFDKVFLLGASYQGLAIDPEGVLSNLGSIVNALAGVFVGRMLMRYAASPLKLILKLTTFAILCLMTGYIWHFILPINKTLWTSSFALVSIGYSCLLLAIFYFLFDVLALTRVAKFWSVIGCNSILIYLSTSIVDWQYLSHSLFGGVITFFAQDWQATVNIVFLLLVQWLFLYWLYRRKIFIKV